MRLFANPIYLQLALLAFFGFAAFAAGVFIIRRLRQNLTPAAPPVRSRLVDAPNFAVNALHAVIQQLKDKEQELRGLCDETRDRATAAEGTLAALLANLPIGVVLFNAAGLVQQANPAARDLLGYAAVSGLHVRDLFRGAGNLRTSPGEPGPAALEGAVELALREGQTIREIAVDYLNPAGQQSVLSITVAPLGAGEARLIACFVADVSSAASTPQA